MAENQLLKPKVLSHEKIYFETHISGHDGGSGDDGGCWDGGGSGGGGSDNCPCLGIVFDFKGIPNRKDIITTINSFGQMLQKTKEGRYLLKRLYDIGPKITSNPNELTLAAILKGVKLIQAGKLEDAKLFFNQELTKFELSTL